MFVHWTPEESFMYEFLKACYGVGSFQQLKTLYDRCNLSELTRQLICKDVLPFFFSKLTNGEVPLELPVHLLRQLKIITGQIALHNTVYQQECVRLIDILAVKGVRSVLLKGFSHAHKLYGDNFQRPVRDLDFLIDVKDYPMTKSVLLSEGYEYSATNDDGSPVVPGALVFWEQLLKEMHFSKAQGCYQLNIDVHWDFSALWWAPVRSAYPLNQIQWFQFTEKSPLLRTTAEWLIPELHFTQCIYHFTLNNHFTGLKWFIDLCQYVVLMADQLDWDLIYRFAPTRDCKKVFWVALMLVFAVTGRREHWGLKKFIEKLDSDVPAWQLSFYKSRLFAGQSVLSKHLCSALLPCTLRSQLKVALFMLFDPAPMQLWDNTTVQKPRFLQPAHIACRMLRLRRR